MEWNVELKADPNFEKNVFINCPFDSEFRRNLLAIIFTIKYIGLKPRLTLETEDSSTTRLATIVELIDSSKFGIHDLSRAKAVKKNELARMNMPFELGLDMGCKKFKSGEWSSKEILIMANEKYTYQAALSDIAGSDIKNHRNDHAEIIKVIRNWFGGKTTNTLAGHSKIWDDFNYFDTYLKRELKSQGHVEEDIDGISIKELMTHMDKYLQRRPTAKKIRAPSKK